MTDDTSVFEIIRTTRAMRRLRPDPVPDKLIRQILEAGTSAANSANTQRWRFLIVKDPEIKRAVQLFYKRAFDEVEIGRLVEGLDRAMERNESSDVAKFFDALSERYRELGDDDMSDHYIQLKNKYAAQGMISQEDMNFTRHKATQKRSSGVQLVDASSLI